MSIPKIIHFCWFGNNEYPQLIKKCLQTWKDVLPDYKIVIWNENNFDINKYPFTLQAYQSKKWAFVSDFVRLYALLKFGGIYFDTDVEVLKSFTHLLENKSLVLGRVEGGIIGTSMIASEPNNAIIDKIFSYYNNNCFKNEDGTLNTIMNTLLFSKYLEKELGCDVGYSTFVKDGTIIYPLDYFSPFKKNVFGNNNKKYRLSHYMITENTCCVHHDLGSWYSKSKFNLMVRALARLILPSKFYLHLKLKKHIRTVENLGKNKNINIGN